VRLVFRFHMGNLRVPDATLNACLLRRDTLARMFLPHSRKLAKALGLVPHVGVTANPCGFVCGSNRHPKHNLAVVDIPTLYLNDLGLLAARQLPAVHGVLLFHQIFHNGRSVMRPSGRTFPNIFLDVYGSDGVMPPGMRLLALGYLGRLPETAWTC
jgi:hypothetical protein